MQKTALKNLYSTASYLSLNFGRRPSAVGRWPLAVGRWPLAVSRWPLAVSRWPLAVGRRSRNLENRFFLNF